MNHEAAAATITASTAPPAIPGTPGSTRRQHALRAGHAEPPPHRLIRKARGVGAGAQHGDRGEQAERPDGAEHDEPARQHPK